MPRKQRNPKARREPVNPYVYAWLESGELPDRQTLGDGWWDAFEAIGNDRGIEAIWREAQAELLEAWINARPGTRPHGWWQFDAPRWREADKPERARRITAEDFPEPRKRLGGIGDPAYAHLNVWPAFHFGFPTCWVSDFDEAYYNGRSRDIHGKRIGTEYHKGYFKGLAPRPDDPPVYESQAAYLERHNLMSDAERRRLPADAFEPERLEIAADDTPDLRATHPDTWARPCFDETKEGSH